MQKIGYEKLLEKVNKNFNRMVQLCAREESFVFVVKTDNGSILAIENYICEQKIYANTGIFEGVSVVERILLLPSGKKKDRCRVYLVCQSQDDGNKIIFAINEGDAPLATLFLVAANHLDKVLETVVVLENFGEKASYSCATEHPVDSGEFLWSILTMQLRFLGLQKMCDRFLDCLDKFLLLDESCRNESEEGLGGI